MNCTPFLGKSKRGQVEKTDGVVSRERPRTQKPQVLFGGLGVKDLFIKYRFYKSRLVVLYIR